MMTRLRGRFALIVPLLAAMVLLVSACDTLFDDEEDVPPLGTPVPTTPTPPPNEHPGGWGRR